MSSKRSKNNQNIAPFVVQSLSHVQLFATPWAAARQASLSFTISRSLLKFMSIELVMPSTISSSVVPFSSCPQSFPALGYFPKSRQSWAENGTTTIRLHGGDWFIIENMYKISILLQTIFNWTTTEFVFILCYICMLYTRRVTLHKHVHEGLQARKLWHLARNIFLPLWKNFASLEQHYHLIRQFKNVKTMALVGNATKKWTGYIKWICSHIFFSFFSSLWLVLNET